METLGIVNIEAAKIALLPVHNKSVLVPVKPGSASLTMGSIPCGGSGKSPDRIIKVGNTYRAVCRDPDHSVDKPAILWDNESSSWEESKS